MPQPDLPPIHPGEELREEFMLPLGLSADRLAKEIDLPVVLVQAIIDENRAISGDVALRLSRYLSTTPEFWLNMQRDYDLARAVMESGEKILNTVNPHAV
jgi:addiction module HigA family antidote